MAISEDTAALVAAQLTAAWAIRSGVGEAGPAQSVEGQVAEIYARFRNAVGGRPKAPPEQLME